MAFHDLEVNSIQGEKVSLGTYKGKRCLVVNVA
ncbi:MAG: glutathione peroxidase, partial [Gammaproteobacteria bacterium]|nr:glutathione peroxidase [Gammaproteobacteria bacterium]